MSTGKGFQLYFMFEIFHLEKEWEREILLNQCFSKFDMHKSHLGSW